jgi:hypothetical protein
VNVRSDVGVVVSKQHRKKRETSNNRLPAVAIAVGRESAGPLLLLLMLLLLLVLLVLHVPRLLVRVP